MKQDKQDRRSRHTRQRVNTAMLELLFEKRYAEITIQNLLDRADIGRSTFYSHYFDKEDVLASIAEQQLELLNQQLLQQGDRQRIVPALEIFQHVQQNYQYFQAMLRGHARETLWDATQSTLCKTIEQALTTFVAEKSSPSIPLSVVSQYLSGAFLNLLKWWLEAEMPCSPEQAADIFQRLALPGVWPVLDQHKEEWIHG